MTATVAVRVRSDGLRLRVRDLREFVARWDEETDDMTTQQASDADDRFVDIKVNDVLFQRLLGGPIVLEAEVPARD